MKLPTKREYASRSMASAMRSPVLEQKPERYRAARTPFVPMPTNYNELANAQAKAALAEGDSWASMANAFSKVLDVVGEVNTIHNSTRAEARQAELTSFVNNYFTNLDGVNLYEQGPDQKYPYESLQKDFDNALKKFEAELDKKYKLDNPAVAEKYRLVRMGIMDNARDELTKLRNAAEDQRAATDIFNVLNATDERGNKLVTQETLNGMKPQLVAVFGPLEAEKLYAETSNAITLSKYVKIIEDEEASKSNKFLNAQLQGLEAEIRAEGSYITDQTVAQVRLLYQQKMESNRANAWNSISLADNPVDMQRLYEDAVAMGVIVHTQETENRFKSIQLDGGVSQSKKLIENASADSINSVFNSAMEAPMNEAQKARIESAYNLRLYDIARDRALNVIRDFEMFHPVPQEDGTTDYKYEGSGVANASYQIMQAIDYPDPNDAFKVQIRTELGLHPSSNDGLANQTKIVRDTIKEAIQQKHKEQEGLIGEAGKLDFHSMLVAEILQNPGQVRQLVASQYSEDTYKVIDRAYAAFETQQVQELLDSNNVPGYGDPGAELDAGSAADIAMKSGRILMDWVRMTGTIPSTVLNPAVNIVNTAANRPVEEVVQALNTINTLFAMAPEALKAQKGLDLSQNENAAHMATFVQYSGMPPGEAIKAFGEYIKQMHSGQDTSGSLNANISKIKASITNNSEQFKSWYEATAAANTDLPAELPDHFRTLMANQVGVYANMSNGIAQWAYQKAFADISGQFGKELIDKNDPESGYKFVHMSIYRFHDFGRGGDTMNQMETENAPSFQERLSQNDPVAITIAEIAAEHGKNPEEVDLMYSHPKGGREGFWIMVHAGTAIPIKPALESELGHEHYLASLKNPNAEAPAVVLYRDTLTDNARKRQAVIEDTQRKYDLDKRLQDFEQFTEATSISGFVANRLGEGIVQSLHSVWNDHFVGMEKKAAKLPDPSDDELAELEALDKKRRDASSNSYEYMEAMLMKTLLRSDAYRALIYNGRQKTADSLRAHVITLARDQFEMLGVHTLADEAQQSKAQALVR